MDDPVDPSMRLVPQRRLVRIAAAVLESLRRRVVLDDVVVPVDHPHVAVRPDLGHDRRGPLVVAGEQVPRVLRLVRRPVRLDRETGDQVAGRLADEGGAVPVFLRIRPRGVDGVAAASSELAVPVDLPDLVGDRMHAGVFRDHRQHARRHAADLLVVAVRDREMDARIAVGGRAEERAVLAEAEAPRVVAGAGQEFELRAVGLEAEHALLEAELLAADGAAEAGVADHAVDPVVEAVLEIARTGMRVRGAPAAEQDLAFVAMIVALRRTQEQRVRRLRDDDAVLVEREARRDAELVGEDGELVGPADALRVLADDDAIAAFAFALQLVRIVERLRDPQPAALVPVHADRAIDVGIGREQLRLEADRRHQVLLRLLRVERLLHLRQRLVLAGPASRRGVERHLRFLILERLDVRPLRRHCRWPGVDRGGERHGNGRILADGPADAPFDEVLEARVAPGPLVMAPRRVEDAALALRPHPGPRLLLAFLFAVFEDRPILGIVLRVDVGLVPALERREALHDRMRRIAGNGADGAGVVPGELSADERDVLRRVEETERRAVERDQPLAAFDVVENRLLLIRRDLLLVRVDGEAVVLVEDLRRQRIECIGVGELDAMLREGGLELAESSLRLVMAVVAEEEDADRAGVLGVADRREERDRQHSEDASHGRDLGENRRDRVPAIVCHAHRFGWACVGTSISGRGSNLRS